MSSRSRQVHVDPEPSPEVVAAIVAAFSAVAGGEDEPAVSRWRQRARRTAIGDQRDRRTTWRDRARLAQ